jgi:ABC-type Fe3+-hydroxamate transport system substrate-binding protein
MVTVRMLAGLLIAALPLACGEAAEPPPAGELRVISLAPSITRILKALGAQESLVAVDSYSRAVVDLDGVASVGGLYAPDLERAIELRPTLVLAVETAQQHTFLEVLRARGVRVESIAPYSLAEHLESIEAIGVWVGRGAEARAVVERIRRDLDAIAARAPSDVASRPRVAMIVEREPLYVAGRGSFVHDLIEIAGGHNAFDDLAAPFPQVSFEALAERAPALLIDATAVALSGEAAAAEARSFWARFVPGGRVEVLPSPDVALPGVHLASSAAILRRMIAAGRP